MAPDQPIDVANDAIQALLDGTLPKRYDITPWQSKRVWEYLRQRGVYNLGTARDPDGGYWVYQYEEKQ